MDPPPGPTTELLEGAAAAQHFARHGFALVTSVLAPAAMARFAELQAATLREWQTTAGLELDGRGLPCPHADFDGNTLMFLEVSPGR